MPLKVLIIGAGVCGPAFATLLRRSDPDGERYDITVVERAPKLRDSGLQIDIRAQGISVIRKMGCECSFFFFFGGPTCRFWVSIDVVHLLLLLSGIRRTVWRERMKVAG